MNQIFSALLDQSSLECLSSTWRQQVMTDIASKLEDNTLFPCVFAKNKNAFRKQIIKFIFIAEYTSGNVGQEKGRVFLAMLSDTGERYLSTFLMEGSHEGSDDDGSAFQNSEIGAS